MDNSIQSKKTNRVVNELKSNFLKLRAETIVAVLIENASLGFEDLKVNNKSTFTRGYRRDVIEIKETQKTIEKDAALKHKSSHLLEIDLSRNSIYDTLPKGIFHFKSHTNSDEDAKHAKDFFAPIENEMFRYKVYIELLEKVLISQFSDLTSPFYKKFWKLPEDIPDIFSNKIIALLPYAYKISSDLTLGEASLKAILNEDLHFEIADSANKINKKKFKWNSFNKLGVNFTLEANNTIVRYPKLKIFVKPKTTDNLQAKQKHEALLKKVVYTFCDFFIPIDFDFNVFIKYKSMNYRFVLGKNTGMKLGKNAII